MKTREERIKKITKTSTLITGAIISAYGYIMYFITTIGESTNFDKWWWLRLGIVTAFILLTFIVIYWGREKIFDIILKRFWTPSSKNKKILGQFNILIFFDKNKNADRTGLLHFEDSYEGLYITGGNLTDTEGNVTVEKWYAQEAEIHHFTDDKMVLIYQYWLRDDEKKDRHNKLGIVIATSKDGGQIFVGTFKAFNVETGEIDREGRVTINKCAPSV